MTNLNHVAYHLAAVGYSGKQIAEGITYAAEQKPASEDEALSLAVSRILYTADDLTDGIRFAVEPGSVDWTAYA